MVKQKAKRTRKKAPAKKEETPKAEEPPKAQVAQKAEKEAPQVQTKAEKPKAKRKKTKKKAVKAFVARGKRKESIARAAIREGKGTVRFNNINVNAMNNRFMREIVIEPLHYIGPKAATVDISVSVKGGGAMGQVQAARTAIANALVMYFDDMNLREKFIEIDRSLVIEDIRRVEAKKYRGPKARARYQKSYR